MLRTYCLILPSGQYPFLCPLQVVIMSGPIAVVIVNWNGLQYLRACMPAVLAQDYPDFQVVAVDNGSSDGSAAWVESTFPQVLLIRNDTNEGFARATNQGIRATEEAYIALLNNDARPEPDWLAALVQAMESDERVGMVASQVRLAHRPDLLDSAGIEVDLLGMAWNRHFGRPVAQEPTEAVEVFGACGAAALYRRKMLAEVGLFDERYFAYYEDVELAWRAQRAGWRCLYTPAAQVLHLHSATGQQDSAFKAYHLNRNRVWTLIRHYPAHRFLVLWPLVLLLDTASWMGPLLRGRPDALRGHVDALREWRWAWQERCRHAHWSYSVPLAPPRFHADRMPRDHV